VYDNTALAQQTTWSVFIRFYFAHAELGSGRGFSSDNRSECPENDAADSGAGARHQTPSGASGDNVTVELGGW